MKSILKSQGGQLLVIFVCCLLFILLIKPWQLYFLNDDFMHIPMPNQWLFLRGGFFRPVPNFVLLFDKWLYGKNATGFFFTTLALHISCVFSVYFLVKEIMKTYLPELSNSLLAFATAMLFLVYPYHAEAIMWVIARVSIIAAIFTFLSLFFYIKAAVSKPYLFLSWLCFFIALFTYESMWNIVLLFGIISFTDAQKRRLTVNKALMHFALMAATFGAYILLRIYLLKTIAGDGYLEINDNLGKYKLLVVNLVKLTGRNFTPPFENTIYAVIFFIASVVVYAVFTYKVFKLNLVWGRLLIITWIALVTAVITASPLGIDTHYNESERYLYYSSFYYCFFIAFLIIVLVNSNFRFPFLATIVFVFVLLLANLQRNYQHASAVTKSTVKLVAENARYKNAYFIDVPKKYKGSMIFRISLPDAIHWIVPEATYDSAFVVSQVEKSSGILPYKTGELNWNELAGEKGWDVNITRIKTATIDTMLSKEDIIFWYKEDGLYKVLHP
jgi:hypothetical protein